MLVSSLEKLNRGNDIESTDLTRWFSDQGVRVRIRRNSNTKYVPFFPHYEDLRCIDDPGNRSSTDFFIVNGGGQQHKI